MRKIITIVFVIIVLLTLFFFYEKSLAPEEVYKAPPNSTLNKSSDEKYNNVIKQFSTPCYDSEGNEYSCKG